MFEHAQRISQMYAQSTMVPDHFRNNVGNCFVAINLAQRLRVDEFMLMQTLYVVKGNPGMEGKLCIALINGCGKYAYPGLEYEERGDILKPKNNTDGMRAFATDTKTGKRVNGPWITWELVKARGWYDKKGPDGNMESNNWRSMPEQMFTYRAASWFANKNCPEVKMGLKTVDELHDSVELTKSANGTYTASDENPEKAAKDLESKILNGKLPNKPANDEGLESGAKISDAALTAQNAPPISEKVGQDAAFEPINDFLREQVIYKTFDPFNSGLQGRYGDAKTLRMRDELTRLDITWRPSWTGRKLHEKLLESKPPPMPPNEDEANEKEAVMSSILESGNWDGTQITDMLLALRMSTDMRTLGLDALKHLEKELKKQFGV
jgi:hypothetical protein